MIPISIVENFVKNIETSNSERSKLLDCLEIASQLMNSVEIEKEDCNTIRKINSLLETVIAQGRNNLSVDDDSILSFNINVIESIKLMERAKENKK